MSGPPRAHELGIIGCHVCGLVCREPAVEDAACPRCGAALHRRKHDSIRRTWALLLAAFMLYIPANVLPIMRTVSLGDVDDNTIISGVVELWVKGSPSLAVIVFTASIVGQLIFAPAPPPTSNTYRSNFGMTESPGSAYR